MPWWIWPLITLFMLCMIAAGVVVVVLSAIRLAKTCFSFTDTAASKFEALNDSNKSDNEPRDPLFTLPIRKAADRYEKTREKVLERHKKIRETIVKYGSIGMKNHFEKKMYSFSIFRSLKA